MNDVMFRKSAKAALAEWYSDKWDLQKDLLDELVQDLWVWYLESPATQKKLQDSDEFLARRLIYKAALQTLAGRSLNEDVFDGRVLYSADAVRSALGGSSTNKYLREILPFALDNVERRNEDQAEAIRSRYTDGVVPAKAGGAAMVLSRAVKSVTEEVNVIYLTSNENGAGSSSAVFPESRKRKGEHGDPTGNTAVMLDENPEFRHAFYEETPLRQFLGGRGATPEYDLGGGRKFRPTGYTAEVLRRYPQLVKPYLEKVRGELGLAG